MSGNGITNICRPVTLYNKQVPATKDELICDYIVFGEYDGITVGHNILGEDKPPKDLFDFWLSLVDESKKLRGQYVTKTLFIFRSECENENILDQDFFKLTHVPFLFLVMLQYKEYNTNLPIYMRYLEENINSYYDSGNLRAISYLTMDNSDIILLIKARTYDLGRCVINDLHNPVNIFVDPIGRRLTLNNSFSIVGFSKNYLNERLDLKEHDGHIEQVMICAMEREPGSIIKLYNKLKEQINGDGSLEMYERLGNDDEILIWNNASWSRLLPMYRSDSKGILIDEHDDYLKCVHSIITIIQAESSSNRENNKPSCYINSQPVPEAGGTVLNRENTHRVCNYYRSKVLDNMPDLYNSGAEKLEYKPGDTMKMAFGKTLLHILNSLEKFGRSDFPCYLFVSIFEPLKHFIDILYSVGMDNMGSGDQWEMNFINSINILIQNPNGIDRQFLQVPDFNAGIFNIPVKLEAFYSAYVYYVTKLYNSLKAKVKAHTYKFLLCPWVEKQTKSMMMFPQTPPENRVILIQVPEQLLFNPKCLMIILGHEVGHYVGGQIRLRNERYKIARKIIINAIIQHWCLFPGMDRFINNRIKSKCIRFINDKFTEVEQRYLETEGLKKEYKYHSHYMKKIAKNVCKSIFEEYSDEIRQMVLTEYLSDQEHKVYCDVPIYCNYKDFKEKNERNLEKVRSDLLCFDDIWTGGIINLLGNGSEMIFKIVDNVLDTLIECFADLISIIALDLTPLQYLESFFSTLDQVQGASVVVRLCLVVKVMRFTNNDSLPRVQCWQDDWNRLSRQEERGTSMEINALVSVMSKIMLQLDNNSVSQIDFISELKDSVFKEYRLFEIKETWDMMECYLYNCKQECEKLLSESESYDRRETLVSLYQSMCRMTSVENSITAMENTITSYIEHVFEKGVGQ